MPRLSSSLFLLIIICFSLPFVSVSCNNREVAKFTGIQLVTGTEVNQTGLLGLESRKVPPQPWAAIPFGLAVAGVVLGLWSKGRLGAVLRALSSSIGLVSLLLFKVKLQDDALQYPKLVFSIKFLPCYWVAIGVFGVVTVVNLGWWVWVKNKSAKS